MQVTPLLARGHPHPTTPTTCPVTMCVTGATQRTPETRNQAKQATPEIRSYATDHARPEGLINASRRPPHNHLPHSRGPTRPSEDLPQPARIYPTKVPPNLTKRSQSLVQPLERASTARPPGRTPVARAKGRTNPGAAGTLQHTCYFENTVTGRTFATQSSGLSPPSYPSPAPTRMGPAWWV